MSNLRRVDFHAAAAQAPARVTSESRSWQDYATRGSSEHRAALQERRRIGERAKRLDAASETSVPLKHAVRAAVERGELDPRQALEDVRGWLAMPTHEACAVLILCGPTRVGKTVAAADAIASTEGAKYVKAKRLVGLAAAQYGDERALFTAMCTAPLLVIDEIGLEKTEAGAREAMLEIIDERMGLRTLIIGNLVEADVRARMDARTLARLDEVGAFIDVKAEDLRARRGGT